MIYRVCKKHIVKFTYKDGIELRNSSEWITYCEYQLNPLDFYFTSAEHAILAMEQNTFVEPCKKYTNSIIKIINDYHNE